MKNFSIGVLVTILLIISWPFVSPIIETMSSQQPVTITIEDNPTQTRNEANPTGYEKPIIQPMTQATPAAQRSKAHESIKGLFEAGERAGRRND